MVLIIVLVSILSCKKESFQELEYELPELTTQEDHISFLEELFENDQKYRVAKNALDLNSKSYNIKVEQAKDSIAWYDQLNLIKVEKYLAQHPYPSLKIYGNELSIAPIMVVHHQPSYTTARQDFFPVFHEAYRNGDITPNLFSFYLGRWYEMNNGEYYRMESPYMIEEQIDSLIVQLEL